MPDSRTDRDLWLEHIELAQLPSVAEQMIALAGNQRIWLLEGEMGAGKTTLIKAVCAQLRVIGTVQSPTYSLVNEYETTEGQLVYHFDFYRINHPHEAMDMGVEEYFDSGHYCFIEWPSRVATLLPDNYLTIAITLHNNHQRTIHLSRYGQ